MGSASWQRFMPNGPVVVPGLSLPVESVPIVEVY